MISAEKAQFEQGLGNVTWWGFSPAHQVTQKILQHKAKSPRILLCGAGDARHVFDLASAAAAANESSPSSTKKPTHVFVHEQNVLLYARQMLFTAMLQDPEAQTTSARREADERAKQFLEVLGNATLAPRTANRVKSLAERLRQKIERQLQGDANGEIKAGHDQRPIVPNVDLSKLKSKELDDLEAIFRFWRGPPSVAASGATASGASAAAAATSEADPEESVDVKQLWDFRIRQLLTDRYDNKEGLFEMDYQLRFVDRGGANVSNKEYCEWRNTGEAFYWDKQFSANQDAVEEDLGERVPNLTLISSLSVKQAGKKENRLGYWGDVVTGPFISYGFEFSTEVQVVKCRVGRTGQDRAFKAVKAYVSSLRIDDASGPAAMASSVARWPRVTFLPVRSTERDLLNHSKYHDRFDAAFIGVGVTHLLVAEMGANLRKGAIVCVETPLYLLHIAREVQDKFREHLQATMDTCGLDIDQPEYDAYATCIVGARKRKTNNNNNNNHSEVSEIKEEESEEKAEASNSSD